MRLWIPSLDLLSGLRIWPCRGLWCRWQMRLRSGVLWLWCRLAATAPIRPPSLGTSICEGFGPKETKKKKEREKTKPTKGPHPSNQWFIPFSKEWVYIYVESAHQWVWAGGGGGGLSQVFSLLWALVSPSLIWGFQTYFIHSLELRPGHSQVNAESGLWHIVDFFFLVFLRPHVQHMEVPRLGVE